jgi:adenosylhomocysteine nucleosidase
LNGLGIVAALAAESRPLRPPRHRPEAPASLADGTLLIVSGIGWAAAARGARRLIESGARALISWGVAGGLDPALAAGTLVLPDEVVSREGRRCLTAREWSESLRTVLAPNLAVCGGRLLSCAAAVGSTRAKAVAFRETAAAAVDMESLPIAEVAAAHRMPFIAVRAIVDTAQDALPPLLIAAAGTPGPLRIGRLLGSLALNPADLPALIRLALRYRAARRTLVAVARSGALAAARAAPAIAPP